MTPLDIKPCCSKVLDCIAYETNKFKNFTPQENQNNSSSTDASRLNSDVLESGMKQCCKTSRDFFINELKNQVFMIPNTDITNAKTQHTKLIDSSMYNIEIKQCCEKALDYVVKELTNIITVAPEKVNTTSPFAQAASNDHIVLSFGIESSSNSALR